MAKPFENIASIQRKYAKNQMKKLAGGGDLVSDTEMRKAREQVQTVAEAGMQAQQAALNRTQAALATGAPVQAGAIQQAQGALAKTAADTAVQASGQAQDYKAALESKRREETDKLADTMVERGQRMQQLAMRLAEGSSQIPGLLTGAGALGAVASAFFPNQQMFNRGQEAQEEEE